MIEKKFMDESIRRLKAATYVKHELEKAGIVKVEIQRTTLATRIGISAERPGLIIGRKGKTIQDLTAAIESQLGIENPQIEVMDASNQDLQPTIIARWVSRMLERGLKPKRIIQKAIERVMRAGAIGAEITVKGKIQGKGAKARQQHVSKGYMKKAGDYTKYVDEANEKAILKQGIIGVNVKIVPPTVIFPDKIDVRQALKARFETKTPVETPTQTPTLTEAPAEPEANKSKKHRAKSGTEKKKHSTKKTAKTKTEKEPATAETVAEKPEETAEQKEQ